MVSHRRSFGRNRRNLLWLGLIVLGFALLLVSRGKKSQLNRGESQIVESREATGGGPSVLPSPGASLAPPTKLATPPHSNLDSSVENWHRFKIKYGEHLEPKYSADHFLISIEGKVGVGVPRGLEFSPADEDQLKQRADEMLRALSGLIGERENWPIEFREARVGASSGQVFFRETHDGLVVKPSGTVKVDLGPHGELLGFYSDYASQVKTIIPATLSEAEVQERARTVLGQRKGSEGSLGGFRPGERILWVSGSTARVAYEFFVAGRELVVDAQSGRIILFHDLRHY